jgi:Zinc knuckle
MKHKKHHPKVETKQKKEEPAPKAPEAKVQDSAEPTKNNIDDLAEKIGRLTIALNSFDGDKAPRRPGRFMSSMKCFMCGEDGHSLKDCPETKAFLTKKVLKLMNKGQLVQVDGSELP